MATCTKCRSEYAEKRKEMGYTVCVACSTEQRWSGIQVVHHKTGNETQIVKDPEVAAEFLAKSARVGFGTLRGMTSSYKKPVTTERKKKKEEPVIQTTSYTVVSRKPMPLDFEGVGQSVMAALEGEGPEKALGLIEEAVQAHRLTGRQAAQLKDIVNLLSEKMV